MTTKNPNFKYDVSCTLLVVKFVLNIIILQELKNNNSPSFMKFKNYETYKKPQFSKEVTCYKLIKTEIQSFYTKIKPQFMKFQEL